ncbi:hypothetical protein M514_03821 [Trichuris suis]|uniref:Uncharacterized protein n=1 Tax=Trichuris suis TaxID=68888 RepID=A0A085N7I6_9BILA|nr:hypothetical protein M513_03821 [Trichuris suis]KFD65432.1 hypothetical protein M514_03821 [Trichuris suis]
MSLLRHSTPLTEIYSAAKPIRSFSAMEEMTVPDRIIVVDGPITENGRTKNVGASCNSNEVSTSHQVASEERANMGQQPSRSSSIHDVSNSDQPHSQAHTRQTKDADSVILPPKRVNIRYLPKTSPEDDEDLNATEQFEALMNMVHIQEDRLAKMEAQLSECLWLLRSGCALFLIGFVSVIVSKLRRRL